MSLLYLVSVWLHIVAAAVWIGGMTFLALVLVPVLRSPDFRSRAPTLVERSGLRLRTVGWTMLGVLVVTGVVNLAYRGTPLVSLVNGEAWTGAHGRLLSAKLILVAVVLLISLIHDFAIGPQASRAAHDDPVSPTALRLRRRASVLGRLNLVLALTLVALGVGLVRGCAI